MNKINPPIKIPEEVLTEIIYVVRERKVMLDHDLAKLYGVETKRLKEQVRRNLDRFPDDFMFELSNEEFACLRSQFATSSWGGARFKPMAFSELGVAMLSSVLNSKRAILINIQIMRAFARMRKLLTSNVELLKKLEDLEKKDDEQDEKIMIILKYLKKLEHVQQQKLKDRHRKPIGYKRKGEYPHYSRGPI